MWWRIRPEGGGNPRGKAMAMERSERRERKAGAAAASGGSSSPDPAEEEGGGAAAMAARRRWLPRDRPRGGRRWWSRRLLELGGVSRRQRSAAMGCGGFSFSLSLLHCHGLPLSTARELRAADPAAMRRRIAARNERVADLRPATWEADPPPRRRALLGDDDFKMLLMG